MTYWFGFYGSKTGGGGSSYRVLSINIEHPEIRPILGYVCRQKNAAPSVPAIY